MPHPVQPLSTLRTPRCRDARKTRSRPACSALNGPDFHWQAHSSFLSHPAPGSCRRSDVIASKAFSSARNLDPCAPRFGGLPIPVLRPGLAWRSTLPPAAPLPSTPSATAHTLSPRAITALFGCFIGTTSASDSSPVPRQIALLACCRGPGSPQRLRTRRGLPGSDAIPLRVMGSSTTVERQRLA